MPITSTFFTSALHTGAAFLLLKHGDPVDPKQVKIETGRPDRDVSINVELTRDRNDLIATGYVRPTFGCWDPPMWRKVKIQILSAARRSDSQVRRAVVNRSMRHSQDVCLHETVAIPSPISRYSREGIDSARDIRHGGVNLIPPF